MLKSGIGIMSRLSGIDIDPDSQPEKTPFGHQRRFNAVQAKSFLKKGASSLPQKPTDERAWNAQGATNIIQASLMPTQGGVFTSFHDRRHSVQVSVYQAFMSSIPDLTRHSKVKKRGSGFRLTRWHAIHCIGRMHYFADFIGNDA
jgi:hypothetical protein